MDVRKINGFLPEANASLLASKFQAIPASFSRYLTALAAKYSKSNQRNACFGRLQAPKLCISKFESPKMGLPITPRQFLKRAANPFSPYSRPLVVIARPNHKRNAGFRPFGAGYPRKNCVFVSSDLVQGASPASPKVLGWSRMTF